MANPVSRPLWRETTPALIGKVRRPLFLFSLAGMSHLRQCDSEDGWKFLAEFHGSAATPGRFASLALNQGRVWG
jgi:hypothetical protein